MVTKELEINHDVNIGYSTRTKAAYSFAQEQAPKITVDPETATGKVAVWGTNNDFPQVVEADIMKNPDLVAALDWKARAMYGGGLTYHKLEVDENGEAVYKDVVIPEIETFLKRNWQYPIAACAHFYKFYMVFPEMGLTADRKELRYLNARDASECRFEVQDKKTRLINKVYVSAKWADGATADDPETFHIPVLDPRIYDAELLRQRQEKNLTYIYPIAYPTGRKYYQLAHWDSIRQSKWLQLANAIPSFKLALMKNQITLKYHVQMPDYWMSWKYPKYETLAAEKKKELTQAEIDKFDKFLGGLENSGKSITSIYKTDPSTMKAYPGWIITAIEDRMKEGAYLEDSQEATIKIFSAVGVDPALAGIIPGKSGANRNGSDKREALNIYLSLCKAHEEIILQPYYFIADYNNWTQKYGQLVWSFVKPYMQTLNQITPSQRDTTINEPAD